MATVSGISQVTGIGNAWVQLPNQACEDIIFRGSFDIAFSATPVAWFHIDRDMGAVTVPVVGNANTLWIRANALISFIYYSP